MAQENPIDDDLTSFDVTKEFLEQALNKKWTQQIHIEKFSVAKGSLLGDGYSAMLITVDVWLKDSQNLSSQLANWCNLPGKNETTKNRQPAEELSLVIKCYPQNPARQEFLEARDFFKTELEVYEQLAPAVEKELEFKLPFPPFIAGQALTREEMKELKSSRPLKPLDNYIMMVDVRKHGDFRLRDRFLGFDLDHYRMVIETQAYLHALSWAFKCKNMGVTLTSLFPSLDHKTMADNTDLLKPKMDKVVAMTRHFVTQQPHLFGEDRSQIFRSLDDLDKGEKMGQTFSLYYDRLYKPSTENPTLQKYTKDSILRRPGHQVRDEVPWSVLLQGDSWSNNMMFRYDEKSGKPVQVILLDLQIAREGDPMADIVYALYHGTTREFRTKNLDSMLHVYFDRFSQLCHQLSVPLLPDFTWTEFQRRFHRAKIFGLAMGLLTLPADLKKPDYLVDLEKMYKKQSKKGQKDGGGEEKDMEGKKINNFIEMMNPDPENVDQYHPAMMERLSGMLVELTEMGVV